MTHDFLKTYGMLPNGSTVSVLKKRIITKIRREQCNLEATLTSGQSFSWRKGGDFNWRGWIGGQPCLITAEGDNYCVWADQLSRETVEDYFQLNFALDEAIASFPQDEWLRQALSFAPGIRILRQDPWETLASFICSSVKQIVQIQAINHNLRQTFGSEVIPGEYDFPRFGQLALAGELALRACKLGFRARHLHRTAQKLQAEGIDLTQWHQLPTKDLKDQLLALPGVGEKIADCVLLFAYGRYEVFPIDVWVERVLKTLYFAKARNKSTRRLRQFSLNYFGPYRGYAQQYLFHWIRTGAPVVSAFK